MYFHYFFWCIFTFIIYVIFFTQSLFCYSDNNSAAVSLAVNPCIYVIFSVHDPHSALNHGACARDSIPICIIQLYKLTTGSYWSNCRCRSQLHDYRIIRLLFEIVGS